MTNFTAIFINVTFRKEKAHTQLGQISLDSIDSVSQK